MTTSPFSNQESGTQDGMVLWCWIALDYARLKGAQSQVAFVDYTLCFVFERGEGETDAKFLPYIYLSLNQKSDTMSCLIKPRFFFKTVFVLPR